MRELLPNRRRSELVTFEHDQLRFHGSVSRCADGRIGEAFLELAKPGGAAGIAARDAAVAASLALQFGCPAETLRHALTRLGDGSAAGPLGKLLDIFAGSDLSARVDEIARKSEPPLMPEIEKLIELADEIDGGAE